MSRPRSPRGSPRSLRPPRRSWLRGQPSRPARRFPAGVPWPPDASSGLPPPRPGRPPAPADDAAASDVAVAAPARRTPWHPHGSGSRALPLSAARRGTAPRRAASPGLRRAAFRLAAAAAAAAARGPSPSCQGAAAPAAAAGLPPRRRSSCRPHRSRPSDSRPSRRGLAAKRRGRQRRRPRRRAAAKRSRSPRSRRPRHPSRTAPAAPTARAPLAASAPGPTRRPPAPRRPAPAARGEAQPLRRLYGPGSCSAPRSSAGSGCCSRPPSRWSRRVVLRARLHAGLPRELPRRDATARGRARGHPGVAGLAALLQRVPDRADHPLGAAGAHREAADGVLDAAVVEAASGKISLNLWFHQSLDILWIVNGVIFVVLLFATGQWMRIVPTSWAVVPERGLGRRCSTCRWTGRTENGWVNYNSLQLLAYFATVFIAAPLAIAHRRADVGVWPKNAKALNRIYPVEWARAVHFPVMLYFVAFIVVHVALVLRHRGAAQPQPHVRGAGCRQLARASGSSSPRSSSSRRRGSPPVRWCSRRSRGCSARSAGNQRPVGNRGSPIFLV